MEKNAALLTDKLWAAGLLPCYFELDEIARGTKVFNRCNVQMKPDVNTDDYSPLEEYNSMIKALHYLNFDHIRYFKDDRVFRYAFKVEEPYEYGPGLIINPEGSDSFIAFGNANSELWRIADILNPLGFRFLLEELEYKKESHESIF